VSFSGSAQTAGGSGKIGWSWHMESKGSGGTGNVNCTLQGQSRSATADFTLGLSNKTNKSKFRGDYADAPRHVIMGAGRIYMTLHLAHCLHRDGDHTGGHERRDSGASEVVKNRMPRTRKDTPVGCPIIDVSFG
jgi:hypothetical protein